MKSTPRALALILAPAIALSAAACSHGSADEGTGRVLGKYRTPASQGDGPYGGSWNYYLVVNTTSSSGTAVAVPNAAYDQCAEGDVYPACAQDLNPRTTGGN